MPTPVKSESPPTGLHGFQPIPTAARRVGLLAGWGRLPVIVAESLRNRGYQVFCLGIAGHADCELAHCCDAFELVGLTRMGAHLRFFRKHGIRQMTLAGKIHKVFMFQRGVWLKQIPDLKCVRTFFPHFITGTKDCADDSLLTAAVNGYRSGGVEIVAATELVPELLMRNGFLSGRQLSKRQTKDVEFGWKIAKQLGGLDIGQTVAVKGQAVLALEAVEGTDPCIRRAGALCPAGGFTVVKVAKPQQDMRFDVPTIGIGTLQTLKQAGGTVLAIEADKTIVLEYSEVARYAVENGISIVALREGQVHGEDLRKAA